eukprot:GHRR01026988.1.p1 GENE.GHRR01026988.1~~GHRR01026988.1.p1  ORF type:complete len:228 (+),score=65.95 GHRR01026988.1:189-872(+)
MRVANACTAAAAVICKGAPALQLARSLATGGNTPAAPAHSWQSATVPVGGQIKGCHICWLCYLVLTACCVLQDGQVVYPEFGIGTGEGKSAGNCPSHKVRIINHYTDEEIEVEVPQDRYILWEAEEQGFELPWACRMGCCTACAVKVKEGEVYQPQALGVSEELKQQGYALMCVSFPVGDCVLETVPDDEVYDLQFGRYFAQQALNPNNPESIERDDFAIEIAMGDE